MIKTMMSIGFVLVASGVAGTVCNAEGAIRISRVADQQSVVGSPKNFIGRVRVDQAFSGESPSRINGAMVTFEPGSRTAWHVHPLGQTLIIISGVGRIQEWGGPILELHPGDVVWIPPGVKHWHGAGAVQGMSHIAISEKLDGRSVDWQEPVSDEQYGAKN